MERSLLAKVHLERNSILIEVQERYVRTLQWVAVGPYDSTSNETRVVLNGPDLPVCIPSLVLAILAGGPKKDLEITEGYQKKRGKR
jgi:hypothetical protein